MCVCELFFICVKFISLIRKMSKQSKDCHICGKKYKRWQSLFYHKRKIHNCDNVRSAKYDLELKNAAKIAERRAKKCPHCPKFHRKPTMEEHFKRVHKDKYVYVTCKLCQKECREGSYNDHTNVHNSYGRGRHFMDPEELDKLFVSSSSDDALVALTAAIEKQRDFDNKYFSST